MRAAYGGDVATRAPRTERVCACEGYLFKKTRDGKWQKRWFETNGCFLTYYKVRELRSVWIFCVRTDARSSP